MQATPVIPVAFGHWLIEGDRLLCRQPRRVVTVRAPNRLLAQVSRLCDGSLRWGELEDRLSLRWPRATVREFLRGLAAEGVVVEASQLWAHWSDVAQLPQCDAAIADEDEIAGLPMISQSRLLPGEGEWTESVRRGSEPVAAALRARRSRRTFDDAPLSREALASIVWAAHGVTRSGAAGDLHRTCASGGNMHSARWVVAVLRQLPAERESGHPLAAGVYEVRFHHGGGASFERLHRTWQGAWSCLRDPRVLRFASALLLPLFDVTVPSRKYGNRATMFALIEAGQCLQNAQLMATSLGAAAILRGDTIASEAIRLGGLGDDAVAHWLSIPSMVVGAAPSAEQIQRQATDNRLRVAPSLRWREAGFAFAASPASGPHAAQVAGAGRAADPSLAMVKAEAETWERVAWASPASDLLEARIAEVRGPIPPEHLVAYAPVQYRNARFDFTPFSARRAYLWCEALDVDTGARRSVLADCVHARYSLDEKHRRFAYTSTSTSGVAAGATSEDALTRAALELIERDAFACAWVSGGAPGRIDESTLPGASARRVAALRDAGLDVVLLDLGSTWCPVVGVFLQSHELPFTAITAAAGFDATAVLDKALDEAEGRYTNACTFPVPEANSVDALRQTERYYRQARTYRRSDFFIRQSGPVVRLSAIGRAGARSWADLRDRMRRDGFDVFACDITPDGAAVEQGRAPIRVVRAIIPGLVPIWFRRGTQPLGMPRLARLAGGRSGRPAGHFLHPFT